MKDFFIIIIIMEKEYYIKIKKKYMKDILKMENMMELV